MTTTPKLLFAEETRHQPIIKEDAVGVGPHLHIITTLVVDVQWLYKTAYYTIHIEYHYLKTKLSQNFPSTLIAPI